MYLNIVFPALSKIFTTFDKSRWGETGGCSTSFADWVVARRWIGCGSLSAHWWCRPCGCCSLTTESSLLSLDARSSSFFFSRLLGGWIHVKVCELISRSKKPSLETSNRDFADHHNQRYQMATSNGTSKGTIFIKSVYGRIDIMGCNGSGTNGQTVCHIRDTLVA